MVVMFQPTLPNAIFVPLASVNWSRGFQANSTDGGKTWGVTAATAPPAGALSSQPTAIFPTWIVNLYDCLLQYPF